VLVALEILVPAALAIPFPKTIHPLVILREPDILTWPEKLNVFPILLKLRLTGPVKQLHRDPFVALHCILGV